MCLLPEFQDDIQLLNGEITAKQKSLYEVSYLTAMYDCALIPVVLPPTKFFLRFLHTNKQNKQNKKQNKTKQTSTIYTMELHEGDKPFFSGYSA